MSPPMPTSAEPEVSIILPVYNGSATVAEAIRSVLAQTLLQWELLIINDASTDSTPEVIASFKDSRIRAISVQKNIGRSAARNLGARNARGTFLAMIDADDLWAPEHLLDEVSFLKEHPAVAVCGTWAHLVDSSGRTREWRQPLSDADIRRNLIKINPFIHSTVVIRKQAFDEAGGYDEALDFAEDYDLFLRISRKHVLANLPRFSARYRHHSDLAYSLRDQCAKFRVRWRAIARYGFPKRNLPFLVVPFLTAMIPVRLRLALKEYFL